ncbi:hypothetical protein E1258_30395 [Micromonospora sp. KC207]|uniref:hypothetical protein n=1 Tax=Micromonospora sp. KC207 TaxID=2530377 RepID=UPI001044126A|nr:hypothetical protein [Micromonospora sp. KC207]TDC45397.1 hypothetical protein E1258_30395 [Micromonospora sp. KC207]
MTADQLERAIRETLSRQAAVPRPCTVDPAGLAIRRATRTRRRRLFTGTALAGMATVLVSVGMVQLSPQAGHPTPPTVVLGDPRDSSWPAPEPVPGPSGGTSRPSLGPAGAAVDLVVNGTLYTSGRTGIPLGVVVADRAQRVPDRGGWLVVGAPTVAGRALLSVHPDGSTRVLLAGAEAIAVAPDGGQVAWRDGDRLSIGGIVGDQLVAVAGTSAPGAAVPVGFAGNSVLVRRDPARPGYALWHPSAGGLPADGWRDVIAVHGALPDGRLVGMVPTGTPRRPCLALLDPTRALATIRTACGPNLSADGPGGVSTDGRWLLANGRTGSSGPTGALLIDLATLDGTPAGRPAGPALAGAVSWTPAGTAWYVDARGGLVRVRPDRVVAGERAAASPVTGVEPTGRPVVVTDPAP